MVLERGVAGPGAWRIDEHEEEADRLVLPRFWAPWLGEHDATGVLRVENGDPGHVCSREPGDLGRLGTANADCAGGVVVELAAQQLLAGASCADQPPAAISHSFHQPGADDSVARRAAASEADDRVSLSRELESDRWAETARDRLRTTPRRRLGGALR